MGDFSTATTTILPSHGRRRQSPEVSAVYRVGSFVLSKHAAISTRRSPLLLHAHKIVARDGGSKVYVSYSPCSEAGSPYGQPRAWNTLTGIPGLTTQEREANCRLP